MSIASELNNLEGNIEDSYDAVNDMGGIIPAQRNMDNLDQAIRTIPQSQGTTYTAGYGIDIDQNDEISVDTTVIAEKTDIPTATSDLTNDGSDGSSTYVEASDLAAVATSGDYGDLLNTPTIPTNTSDLTNDGDDGVHPFLATDDVATVATSGLYSDLTGTPTIPTSTSDLVNDGSDGTSTYVEADDLATVATSGLYSDLTGTPTIPAAQVNSDWNANSGVEQILNKPSLATVATSGSYTDLTNKPTIPAAQVQSNWTQTDTSAADYIKNKPTIPTVNNATLTIQKNGTTVKTFTANASSNVTCDITVPTVTSSSTQLDVGSWHFFFFSFSNSTSGWVTKEVTHPTAFRGKVKHVSCFGLWGNSGDNRLGAWVEYNSNTVIRLRINQATAGSNMWMGMAVAYY